MCRRPRPCWLDVWDSWAARRVPPGATQSGWPFWPSLRPSFGTRAPITSGFCRPWLLRSAWLRCVGGRRRGRWLRCLWSLAVPILAVVIVGTGISRLNQQHYGVPVVHELAEPNFVAAFRWLTRLAPRRPPPLRTDFGQGFRGRLCGQSAFRKTAAFSIPTDGRQGLGTIRL